jgi:hypothetical protein
VMMMVMVVIMVIVHGDFLPIGLCSPPRNWPDLRYFFFSSIGRSTVCPAFTSTSMVMGPIAS